MLLDQLSQLGLKKLWDLIDNYDWNPKDIDLCRLLMEAIRIALGTQTKVDETKLRSRQSDMMPEILERILKAKANRPPIIDVVPN